VSLLRPKLSAAGRLTRSVTPAQYSAPRAALWVAAPRPRPARGSSRVVAAGGNSRSLRESAAGSPPAGSRGIFIQVEPTPNPASLKFLPGLDVLGWQQSEDGEGERQTKSMDIPRSEAFKSPLAQVLYGVDGVVGVFLGSDFVTVTKDEFAEWTSIQPQLFSLMTDFFHAEKDVLDENAVANADTAIQEGDSEVVRMIKELLETRVRPAVAVDGGDIVYHGFEDGVVLLKMQGSCKGCPSSSVTLKQGIERMMMHWIPEVLGVVAVDDDDLEKINTEAFNKVEDALAAEAEGLDTVAFNIPETGNKT
jgi:NFU1 iron-sulfur cluster scaffold homolog, mitochondrial